MLLFWLVFVLLISFLVFSSSVFAANENPSSLITDEIISTTLDNYTQTVVIDQLILGLPFMNKMIQNPYNKGQNGGHRFKVPLRTKKTDGLSSFGMGDTITPQRKPVVTVAWGTFKQALAYVMFDWVEERMNGGPGKLIDIVSERMQATLQDAKEDFQTMLWADGTGNGGKDFMGIQGLIPTDPRTGVVMGYDRASNHWWRNWYWDGATYGPHPIDADAAAGPQNVGAFGTFSASRGGGVATSFFIYETAWNSTQQGESPGDIFWISDQAVYEYYSVGYPLYQHNVELPLNEDIASFGFGGVMFKNAPWMYDTVENGAPASELRLINQKYLYLQKDTGAWLVWLPWREPFNQLARAKFLTLRGNMVQSYPRKQAVFQGITAWVAA